MQVAPFSKVSQTRSPSIKSLPCTARRKLISRSTLISILHLLSQIRFAPHPFLMLRQPDIQFIHVSHLQQALQLRGIEAGTSLVNARQVTMAEHPVDGRKLLVQLHDESRHRHLLLRRASVGRIAILIQASLVTDPDAVGIENLGMGTG